MYGIVFYCTVENCKIYLKKTKKTKQILNLNSASIKDIIFATKVEIMPKK